VSPGRHFNALTPRVAATEKTSSRPCGNASARGDVPLKSLVFLSVSMRTEASVTSASFLSVSRSRSAVMENGSCPKKQVYLYAPLVCSTFFPLSFFLPAHALPLFFTAPSALAAAPPSPPSAAPAPYTQP
jgi:hypothetical protein